MIMRVAWLGCATAVVASRNGLGRTPLMGWSTWCTSAACDQPAGVVPKNNTGLHDFCDEALVLSSAQALVSTGLRAAGYDHVLIGSFGSCCAPRCCRQPLMCEVHIIHAAPPRWQTTAGPTSHGTQTVASWATRRASRTGWRGSSLRCTRLDLRCERRASACVLRGTLPVAAYLPAIRVHGVPAPPDVARRSACTRASDRRRARRATGRTRFLAATATTSTTRSRSPHGASTRSRWIGECGVGCARRTAAGAFAGARDAATVPRIRARPPRRRCDWTFNDTVLIPTVSDVACTCPKGCKVLSGGCVRNNVRTRASRMRLCRSRRSSSATR